MNAVESYAGDTFAPRIAYKGQLTAKDCVRAYTLHFKPSRASILVRVLLVAGLGLVWAASTFFPAFQPAAWLGLPQPAYAFLFAGLSLGASGPWWYPRSFARRQYRLNSLLHEPSAGTITTEGIHPAAAGAETPVPWETFVQHKRSADTLLLYSSPQAFSIYTRNLFASQADWQAFVGWVTGRVPGKA